MDLSAAYPGSLRSQWIRVLRRPSIDGDTFPARTTGRRERHPYDMP